MSLENLKSKINKNVKGTHCDVMSNSDVAKIERYVDTNHYDLNRIISGSLFKGIPEKCLTMLVGSEASFKSSMMCLSAANAQKNHNMIPVMIDSEGAYTTDFLERWGIDCDNVLYVYEPFVDNISSILGQLLESEDNNYFITIDSIGSLETQKLADDSLAGDIKADQGALAKKIKRMLKMLLAVIKKKNSIGVVAGHYYGSPNQYGAAEEIGGGKFCKLAPHIIISLKKSKIFDSDKKDKKVIGNKISGITLKNRFYPAFQEAVIDIDYQKGVNKFSNLDKIAIDAGLITQGGAWYTNTVTGEKVQGSSKIHKIMDNDLLVKLDEYVQTTGYSSINKEMEETLKEADELIDEEFDEDEDGSEADTGNK